MFIQYLHLYIQRIFIFTIIYIYIWLYIYIHTIIYIYTYNNIYIHIIYIYIHTIIYIYTYNNIYIYYIHIYIYILYIYIYILYVHIWIYYIPTPYLPSYAILCLYTTYILSACYLHVLNSLAIYYHILYILWFTTTSVPVHDNVFLYTLYIYIYMYTPFLTCPPHQPTRGGDQISLYVYPWTCRPITIKGEGRWDWGDRIIIYIQL